MELAQQDSFADGPQFEARPSQLGCTHLPPLQLSVGEAQAMRLVHVVPQAPGSFRFVSHPSFVPPQSPHPELQLVVPHSPFAQDAVPFAVEQATAVEQVAPHVATAFRSVSQSVPFPSQLAIPAAQFTQLPFVQVWVPLAQVSIGSVVTKSRPQATRFIPWQTTSPGFFPTHSGTIASQNPVVPPGPASGPSPG
jgi:hypothetical protein